MSNEKKVVFCNWGSEKEVSQELGDCYILSSDNWDDYGYETSFNVNIYKNGEEYDRFTRKILFEQQEEIASSSGLLSKLLRLQKKKFIEIQSIKNEYNFISLGYEYSELKKIFPDHFEDILKILNDVIYLMKKEPENELLKLREHKGFDKSLCRDQSAKKVLDEGNFLLFGDILDSSRFQFDFKFQLDERVYNYSFNFIDNALPHRINALIGKNGSGKSQTLLALSQYFINQDKAERDFHVSTSHHPNFISNIMVFAYNPSETFNVYREESKEYKYLGYRRYKGEQDISLYDFFDIPNAFDILKDIKRKFNLNEFHFRRTKDIAIMLPEVMSACPSFDEKEVLQVLYELDKQNKEIIFDSNNPSVETFDSFMKIYEKDRNNFAHEIQLEDIPYRNKVIEFFNRAFECNGIGLKNSNNNIEFYKEQGFEIINGFVLLRIEAIHDNFVKNIIFDDFEFKLYFFNETKEIYLSSGQQTFVDLVVNLLSLIKTNSLVLIDEPENTLHPNLEIDFMKILKDILDEFDSFAIIATHSSTITREIPSEYVNVIKIDSDNQPVISPPTINTFGGDIGKITNYVFDDIFVKEKPFQDWLKKQFSEFLDFDSFEEEFNERLSYDFMLYARNNWID